MGLQHSPPMIFDRHLTAKFQSIQESCFLKHKTNIYRHWNYNFKKTTKTHINSLDELSGFDSLMNLKNENPREFDILHGLKKIFKGSNVFKNNKILGAEI